MEQRLRVDIKERGDSEASQAKIQSEMLYVVDDNVGRLFFVFE